MDRLKSFKVPMKANVRPLILILFLCLIFQPSLSKAQPPIAQPPMNLMNLLKERLKAAEEARKKREAEEGKQKPVQDEGAKAKEGEVQAVPQNRPVPQPTESDLKTGAAREKAGPSGKGKIENKVTAQGVSFYFDDADVFEVINAVFGEILKVNYIIDPRISGRVNFRTTTPIPNEDILPVMEIILRLDGVGVLEEGGLYRFVPLPEISKEPIPIKFGNNPDEVGMKGVSIVQIVPLTYIASDEMLKILNPLITRGGMIVDIPLRNYLMIADTDANVKRLLQVVKIFDRKEVQSVSKPKVYVYPLQNAKADHVAKILQEIFLGGSKTLQKKKPKKTTRVFRTSGREINTRKTLSKRNATSSLEEPLVTPGTKIFPDEITNSLIILTTPRDYAIIDEVVKKIDIVPRQVLIEALIAEVTLKDELKFGIEWFLKSHFKLGNTPLTGVNAVGESLKSFDPANILGQSGFTFAAIDTAQVVRGLLQTLATEQKVKVIASPHIMVSDNREARIQVGDQIPVQTSQSETSAGTLVTSIQYRDTGATLKVKPQINESGLVSLEITQELSFVTGTGVQDNPIISNRTAETSVVVQDGQTIVIGGLIRENRDSSRTGIPILKDIPILGFLFGSTETSVNRTELIVLITPHVVKSISEAKKVTDEFRKKMKGVDNIWKEDKQKVSPEKGGKVNEQGRDSSEVAPFITEIPQ